jgi:F-type H+-transporting ATPase subunit b
MPQFDPTWFASQIFWLLVIFAIFYYVVAGAVTPKLGAAIEAREKQIEGDLAKAGSLKEETDKMVAAYEKALADSRAKAQAVRGETEATAAKHAAELSARQGAELANKIKSAETRIADARKAALANVEAIASEIAADAVRKLAGLNVGEADAKAAAAAAARG